MPREVHKTTVYYAPDGCAGLILTIWLGILICFGVSAYLEYLDDQPPAEPMVNVDG